jgi:hypothetical protein
MSVEVKYKDMTLVFRDKGDINRLNEKIKMYEDFLNMHATLESQNKNPMVMIS